MNEAWQPQPSVPQHGGEGGVSGEVGERLEGKRSLDDGLPAALGGGEVGGAGVPHDVRPIADLWEERDRNWYGLISGGIIDGLFSMVIINSWFYSWIFVWASVWLIFIDSGYKLFVFLF